MSRSLAGRYELLEQIGEGGMAVVYKAKDKLLNRHVAIKILKPEFIKDVKLVESFKKESQAAASLVHPNIVGVYDVGREGNINYIVMELVEGKILSDMIREEAPLEYNRAVDIAKQIAAGLSCAHKNNIIHKDVKPHNVLVTKDGVAKITDFGIAKTVDNATIVNNGDMVMGSVHYFSPEQARGGYVDEKSDIYSLGIVLYEMLTGKVPFDGDNPVNVALMHINDEMTPPSEIVSGIPSVLEHIILKATDKIQVNRFKTADEMVEALRNVDLISRIVGDSIYLRAGGDSSLYPGHVPEPPKPPVEKKTEEDAKAKKSDGHKSGKKRIKIKFNKVKLSAAIVALICAIPVSGFIYFLATNVGGEIEIPNLTGNTLMEAEQILDELGLELEEGHYVFDSTYDEGIIVSQTPKAGAHGKKGKVITVSISKGSKEGTVPNIVGKSYADAVYLIKEYGYEIGEVTVGDSSLPKDTVVEQTPRGGEEAKAGSVIRFVVSSGTEDPIVMPKVIGMSLEKAKATLEGEELVLGTVSEESSSIYEYGVVIAQQVEPGDFIEKGATVNLTVSKGKGDGEASAKTIALDVDFSDAENEVFFMTVTVSDSEGTRNVFNKSQRFKEDGGEVLSITGTGTGTVTVLFDNELVMKRTVNFNTGEID